jgi:transcription factor SFP1
MDSLEDMEMDDAMTPTTNMPRQQQQFGGNPNLMSLNTGMANTMAAQQAFRSQPTTPATTQAFSLFSNPTVSSVNTPALSTQSLQQRTSPESSMPGTPAELDPNYMMNNFMHGLPMGNNGQMMQDTSDFGNMNFGLANNFNDMTIDEPAKRLFSKQGGLNNAQLQYALKNGNIPMDGEMAKRLREQQLIGGLGGPVPGFPDHENKPFRCPVIGCEKAYKNQNGLKYHKAVSGTAFSCSISY